MLASKVSGFTELASNGRRLPGTVQRHTWEKAESQPFSVFSSRHDKSCQERPQAETALGGASPGKFRGM